ncbi:MAG: iron ABC transporter permease [Desulfovibrionales bacterium]|nr:iron ABC transporter permease [Desulfovibrionales bacterium]
MTYRHTKVFIALFLLFIGTFLLGLAFGGSNLSFSSVVTAIFQPEKDSIASTIVRQLRVPRFFLGVLVGAGLSVAGCVFQGLLRNPLAEPYTLGISGGAALGATLAIVFGLPGVLGRIALPLAAFLGAFLSLSLTYAVAARRRFSIPTLILGGVILSFLFSALVLLILSVADTDKVHGTIIWLMGDLSATETGMAGVAAFPIVGGIVIMILLAQQLNILTLGEEKATYLGLNTESLRKIFFLAASLITGACVAVSGLIGFVGLIVPHFLRRLLGPNHKILIPASALGGAIFLPLCDTIARTIIAPLELPVGVITGIAGGLVFISFILKTGSWEIF